MSCFKIDKPLVFFSYFVMLLNDLYNITNKKTESYKMGFQSNINVI